MAEILILSAAGVFLLAFIGVIAYAMARPAEFFADAPCVRMAAKLRATSGVPASSTDQQEQPR